MSITEIQKKAAKAALQFALAAKIRELLDKGREEYGADDWDADESEAEVIRLATEDE